jgi:hypothetical protein
MNQTTRIFRTTPIGHDAAVLALGEALQRSGGALPSDEGLYERVSALHYGEVAVVGAAFARLEPCIAALGLEPIGSRPLARDEGWDRVSWDAW